MNNYFPYHMHTDYSLLDSCAKYTEYIDKAVECGMKGIGFTEHGKLSGWFKKYQYCQKKGIRFVYGIEVYLTENLEPKVKDNYHTVLLAKNDEGILEINKAVAKSYEPDHFYHKPRITFEELISLSNNVIITSACVGGPLNYIKPENPWFEKLIKRYDYLEIQHHNNDRQARYNSSMLFLATQYNKPLIAATDTHSLNAYESECREIVQEYKDFSYPEEEGWDMTFKTYDELVDMFRNQGSIPEKYWIEAIENTNILLDSIEEYTIDTSHKYPILYGTRENDHKALVNRVRKMFNEKVSSGEIPADQVDKFKAQINEEISVFTQIHMDGFMLSESEILCECRDRGIVIGPGRGSVAGSATAYVIDITDVNSIKWDTVFSRFCNSNRIELGDIDVDVIDTDRPQIFKTVIEKFGQEKCARVTAFGTFAELKAIEAIVKTLAKRWDKEHSGEENPYTKEYISAIKENWNRDQAKTREMYKDVFYYFDGINGVKESQSTHPAGMVISPVTLADNYGVFLKDGEYQLFFDMDECHDMGLVKYDFLILRNIGILKDVCNMINEPFPKAYNINWEDEKVWDDMITSPIGIFQFESDFAFNLLKRMKPKNLAELTLVTAAARPSGESYRDDLCDRKTHDNGSELINNILKGNYGFLVYQEDIIAFLQKVCGFTGSEADTMRRAIAKKKMELIEPMLPKVLDGYCKSSDKPKEVAEEEAKTFLKVIEDASSYMFGKNHSVAYSMITYYCAYYRYYHPFEFIASYLNNAANDGDITGGTELAHLYNVPISAPKYGISKAQYSYDTDAKVISKGIASIKYLNEETANVLYNIAKTEHPTNFADVVLLAKSKNVGQKSIDILVKMDFFSEFGNQRELLQILKMCEFFNFAQCSSKSGTMSMSKKNIKNPEIEKIIQNHACDINKDGSISSSYKFTSEESVKECILDCQKYIYTLALPELPIKVRIANYLDYLMYVPATMHQEDRKTLIILEISPLLDKRTGKPWVYRVTTQSLGSGKVARVSIRPEVYRNIAIQKGDVVDNVQVDKDSKGYWYLTSYNMVY